MNSGSTLIFAEDTHLNIKPEGSLNAVGTEEKPILFTAEQEISGFWKGIQFTFSDHEENEIAHAVMEYGGNGAGAVVLFGNVTSNASNLTLTNSLIQYSGEFGVWLHDASHLSATGNSYNNNQLGDIFVE